MRIGILTAMPEELNLLQAHLQHQETRTLGGRDYFIGKLFEQPSYVVLLHL